MTVITSKYRSDVAKLFIDDVKVGNYYLFVSSTSNTIISNSESSKKSFLEKTIFGKRISTDEVYYAIKNYPWQQDIVYTQYDDTVDIENSKYYVVVYPENNETGDYKVYKCLFNNYGANSIHPPSYNNVTPDQIYSMSDGYVWKYMYSLSAFQYDKYNARGFIPILDSNTSISSSGSEINQIFITNNDTNRGYETVSGFIYQVLTGLENTVTITANVSELNAIENYYANYSFYVTNTNNVSQVYEVETYVYNPLTGRATITLIGGIPSDGILVNSATYSLLPQIKIFGDGTGAVAIPRVSTAGNISSIIMLNSGSGYTRAVASIPDPYAFDPSTISTLDERVILRPVLSPVGGHGSNLIEELSCNHALLYNSLNEFDNVIVPSSNSFASIGIVRNPEFKTGANNTPDVFDNRIEILLDGHSLSVDEIVTQIETANTASNFYNEITFSGKVHEISGNTVYICEYMGAYPNDINTSNNVLDFADISLNAELPLYSSQDEILIINTAEGSVTPSSYVQRSGDVYYMNNFAPITRTIDSREQFKIIIEF